MLKRDEFKPTDGTALLEYLSPAFPSWASPLVYPAIVADGPTADMDLDIFLRLPLDISQGVGTTDSIGSSLVFIVIPLLLMAV